MTEDIYNVKVENIFEGPMDLLIHLIKKNEVDIYDIPIALITDQYLEYVDWMKSLNIDLAGDFLLMAATLTYIKSRMLLPVHDDDDEEEDPRMEIARPLLEYLQIKEAADELAERQLLGEQTFTRHGIKEALAFDEEDAFIHVGLYDLIEAFKSILENITPEHQVDFSEERISIKDRIAEITDILEIKGSVTFEELFETGRDRSMVIITFLAILEMVKLYLVRIVQHSQTGVIRLFYI